MSGRLDAHYLLYQSILWIASVVNCFSIALDAWVKQVFGLVWMLLGVAVTGPRSTIRKTTFSAFV